MAWALRRAWWLAMTLACGAPAPRVNAPSPPPVVVLGPLVEISLGPTGDAARHAVLVDRGEAGHDPLPPLDHFGSAPAFGTIWSFEHGREVVAPARVVLLGPDVCAAPVEAAEIVRARPMDEPGDGGSPDHSFLLLYVDASCDGRAAGVVPGEGIRYWTPPERGAPVTSAVRARLPHIVSMAEAWTIAALDLAVVQHANGTTVVHGDSVVLDGHADIVAVVEAGGRIWLVRNEWGDEAPLLIP